MPLADGVVWIAFYAQDFALFAIGQNPETAARFAD